MSNAINYAQKYERELDQLIRQQAITSDLETPNVNWLDARTFHIPTVSVSGYKTHSRNGGYNRGTVTTVNEPYTLTFDRDIEFFVDKADVDESNQVASAGNITKIFLTENAIPEIDAYRLSKIATRAIAEAQSSTTTLDTSNIFSELKKALLPVRKYGPGNIITYVSSEVMDLLERSEDFTRKIEVTNNNNTIETRVTNIDGVMLKEVWDTARFHTAFNFTDGFVPTASSKEINFLIAAKQSIVAKPKISSIYLFAPGQHTQGDGYLYQNRLYNDLFVKKNKTDGIFVNTKA
ncbi:hypothetical protein V7101_21315 [Bacillus velezensis]|uniref:hypothetical protein n=1 Tax=Bacillus velezensis TaxID=492670 RepID=UPI003000AC82